MNEDRRAFLARAAAAAAGAALLATKASAESGQQPADVNATEDLMREHGVLRRVLLVYGECTRRLQTGAPLSANVVKSAATVIRQFIEGYHEKLEEDEVFPRLQKAGKLLELTRVLRVQHIAGRKTTATILSLATPEALRTKAQAASLVAAMTEFTRMYEPHASREDTVLFPAFHAMFTEKEFDALGDKFEDKEHQVLGSAGFEGTVETVAQLEKELGIYELSQFTPGNVDH